MADAVDNLKGQLEDCRKLMQSAIVAESGIGSYLDNKGFAKKLLQAGDLITTLLSDENNNDYIVARLGKCEKIYNMLRHQYGIAIRK